jgi:hypothetical protein
MFREAFVVYWAGRCLQGVKRAEAALRTCDFLRLYETKVPDVFVPILVGPVYFLIISSLL